MSYEKHYPEFAAKVKGKTIPSNAYFQMYGEYNKLEELNTGPCYARIDGKGVGSKSKYLFCYIVNGDTDIITKDPEGMVKYVDWMVNHSPWHDVFLTKDAEKIVSDRVFVASTEVPSNLLLNALSAMRLPTEYRNVLPFFLGLTDAGLDPCASLVMACAVCGSRGSYTVNTYHDGHKPFGSDQISVEMLNNLRGNKRLHLNALYTKNQSYQDPYLAGSVFKPEDTGGTLDKAIKSLYSLDLIKVEAASGYVNPFKPKMVEEGTAYANKEDTIKCILEFMKRYEVEYA